jgi:AAA+ ATPase superfamily predicted ATPase
MFCNREGELKTLEDEYRQESSSFTVIYGRRRVGKTALIQEFIKNKPAIFFYATEANILIQLENLKSQILNLINKPYLKDISLQSIEQLFALIEEYDFDKKLVFVIDEYQNLAKLDKSTSSRLQAIWDISLKSKNIHLILCGSVVSLMHSEVLDYSAPLYGRRTSSIHLKQLQFRYIKDFIPNLTLEDQMRVFASFGTIAKYLETYDDKKSFYENIKDNILNKNSFLYSEGYFLLKQELNDLTNYFSILESISKGETKIGNIASKLQVPVTHLTRYLAKLIDLDILTKETPITEPNPLKSKNGRYKFKDNFLAFWFFYVYKNYNFLEINQTEAVLQEIQQNFNDRFVSFAFEDYIKEDILYNPEKYLDFVPLKVGRWWNNKEEIDIVAFDDENIAFIECKWQNSPTSKKAEAELIKKSLTLIEDKIPSYKIITKEDYLSEKSQKSV